MDEHGPICEDMPYYGVVLEDGGLLAIDWAKTAPDAIPTRCPWCDQIMHGTRCEHCGKRYVRSVRRYKYLLKMWDNGGVQQLLARSRARRERTRKKERPR